MHKGTCLHAEPHVSVGVCLHTHTVYACVQTPTPMCTQACMHVCAHACTRMHAHTHARARTHAHTHTHTHAHTPACTYSCMHTHTHTHIYACMHVHSCSQTCTYVFTHPYPPLSLSLPPSLSRCLSLTSAYTQKHILSHTQASHTDTRMHAHTHTHACTCKRACTHMRAHAHTCARAHMHMHAQKHIYVHVHAEREREKEVFEVLTAVAITCWLSLSWQMPLVDRWKVRSRCCGRCWGARCAEPPSWSAIWESRRLRSSNRTCRRASTRSRSPRRTYLSPNGGCWCY